MNWEKVDIEGKEVKAVEITEDSMEIVTTDDDKYRMYHLQDCCESVYIEKYSDINMLIGSTIKTYSENSEDYACYESGTLTRFRFETDKGSWEITWIGESNGYYSESVDFEKVR